MHLALLARCRLPRYVLRQHLHLVRHLGRLWLHALLSIVVRQMVAFSASKFIYETFMAIHMAFYLYELVRKDEKILGRWPERRDFRARWSPHAV